MKANCKQKTGGVWSKAREIREAWSQRKKAKRRFVASNRLARLARVMGVC